VNNPTAIAGITENENYMSSTSHGDQALSVYFRAFGDAGGPVIRFATYTTGSDEPITLDLTLEVDEIDGSWNFIYFGYNHETN
jgi:hypothetical protein